MKYRPRRSTLILLALAGGFVLWTRGPQIRHAYRMEGTAPTPAAPLATLEGEPVRVPAEGRRLILFWATWCAPCRSELARVDLLVRHGRLPRERVLAVSVDDNLQVVRDAQKERGYGFPVYWDPRGELARLYGVRGTPTLVLLDKDDRVHWMSMGLSPTLELRLLAFFAGEGS